MQRRDFFVGDPAPWFTSLASNNAAFHFETMAGRYVVMSFIGSAAHPDTAAHMQAITGGMRALFDDSTCCFFSVTCNPDDEQSGRLVNMVPGIRHFWDWQKDVSRLYGAYIDDEPHAYRCSTLVLDPLLRVLAHVPHLPGAQHIARLESIIRQLPPLDAHAGVGVHAPVLILPRIFEPDFCRELITLYNQHGGYESGFMREKDGKTVPMMDYGFKRRKDFMFDEGDEFETLRQQIRVRLRRRLIPEMAKSFQFHVSRIERYIVACYEGEVGGYFRAHRDNTTKGTAHRRFACTINLNAEEFDGGELRFPEFGTRSYRAPTGGAVVFSCSLLHEALPVTRGLRYACLPFLYDEAAAVIRQQNHGFISSEIVNLNADAT